MWILGSRLIVVLVLLFPDGLGEEGLLTFCRPDPGQTASIFSQPVVCTALSIAQLSCILSFASGSLVRVFALPVIALLGLHVLSNIAGALAGAGAVVLYCVRADGDWPYAAMYVGAIVITSDLLVWGSGAWSVDALLDKVLSGTGNR
jgi:hypothetical protein